MTHRHVRWLAASCSVLIALQAVGCQSPFAAAPTGAASDLLWQSPVRLVLLPLSAASDRVPEDAPELVTSRVLEALVQQIWCLVIPPTEVALAARAGGVIAGDRLIALFAPDAVLRGVVTRYAGTATVDGRATGPATVAFDLRLELPDGTLIWSGTYDERQRHLTEDVGSFARARRRGFRWVLPETLAAFGATGLVERLATDVGGATARR